MPVEALGGWRWAEEPVASSGHHEGYLPAEPPPTGDSGSVTGWVVKRRMNWKPIGTPKKYLYPSAEGSITVKEKF